MHIIFVQFTKKKNDIVRLSVDETGSLRFKDCLVMAFIVRTNHKNRKQR